MRVVCIGSYEEGSVAAIGDAIVEEEAKETRCCGHASALFGEDVFPNDFFEVWACVFVVIDVELCGGEGKGNEEKEENWESHASKRRVKSLKRYCVFILFSFFLPLLGLFGREKLW